MIVKNIKYKKIFDIVQFKLISHKPLIQQRFITQVFKNIILIKIFKNLYQLFYTFKYRLLINIFYKYKFTILRAKFFFVKLTLLINRFNLESSLKLTNISNVSDKKS